MSSESERWIPLPAKPVQKYGLSIVVCLATLSACVPNDPPLPPYPNSSVITKIKWADTDSVKRSGHGSDNWPITATADGQMFVAYGDGWGFSGEEDGPKLSLGLAQVSGGPSDLTETNILSASGQQFGQGPAGMKASGLIAVNGRLLMWARNADGQGNGCRLALSDDGAVSWLWADWRFPQFGFCTFLNAGPGYKDRPDEFLYVYTPNGRSAYEPSDSFILLRVAVDKPLEQDEYEAFAGLRADGSARWSRSLEERMPVFRNPGNSLRLSVTYIPILKRYISWQQLPSTGENGVDTRFGGGFGIYDAPTPWGPWSTVYFTEDWDIGPGELGTIPSHWVQPDGTFHLLFSGDDSFSIRAGTMVVSDQISPD